MNDRKPRVPLSVVEELEREVKKRILPYTVDYMVVGSVGRKEAFVGDLDILVYPKKTGIPEVTSRPNYQIGQIQRAVESMGQWHKGGSRQMTVRNIFNSGINLDLFLCHPPAQWGVLVAVRLNPAELVIWMKTQIDVRGYEREHGTIHQAGREVKVPTEEDYFKLAGLEWCPAEARRELAWQLGLEPI